MSSDGQGAGMHYRLGYRPDVEGLRAVAILLVVASHAGLPWLEGGFVGVDVFFVLSGYLITGLIVQEVRTSGSMGFVAFFGRRLRRLLPALLFMVVCVSGAAAVLLAPLDHPEQAVTAGAASVWVSNFFFAFRDLDYFSSWADTNLFLHTWSLGVEEQFYLVWPPLVMLFLGAFRWQGRRFDAGRLRRGMYATIRVSLVISIFLALAQPLWGFYLMPSRAWQFALGAVVLLWSSRDGSTLVGSAVPRPAGPARGFVAAGGWLGIGMIAAAAVFLDRETTYPGWWALLPSLGTALVLYSGSTSSCSGLGRVLTAGPMQSIGRISYSWYLWHWPVLVLGGVVAAGHGVTVRAALVLLSLALAVLSYRLVELPIRRSGRLARQPAAAVAAAVLLMGGSVAAATLWHDNAGSWARSPELQRFAEARRDLPAIYGRDCDDWYHSAELKPCVFGAQDADRTAVLLGDSVAAQWFPAVRAAFDRQGWRLLVLTKSSCPMVDEPWFYERIGAVYRVCDEWRDAALEMLSSVQPEIVFTGNSSGYGFDDSQWTAGSARVLSRLSAAAERIFLIRANPQLGFDGPACLAERHWRTAVLPLGKDCEQPSYSTRDERVHRALLRASDRFENVAVLDLNPLICPGGLCQAERQGLIVYRDGMHLAARFVETLGNALAARVPLGSTGAPPPRSPARHGASPGP